MDKNSGKKKNEAERHVDVVEAPEAFSLVDASPGMGSFDSKLEISYDKQDAELLSFRQWHRRMQVDHDSKYGSIATTPTFSMWGWCNCLCGPCRYIEGVDYNKKICYYFLRFRTFKTWTTGIIILAFVYVILLQSFGSDILPGGTYFYLFIMFLTAFLVGNILFSYGIPGTIGQMVVGIVFANLPFAADAEKTMEVTEFSEKCMLLIIVIRASLLLDFGNLYGHVPIIAQLALIPYSAEFVVVLLFGHYVMKLPWTWSALQGIVLAPVSLASTLAILEKSKKSVFSEPNRIPTVIIAACSIQIIITIYVYSILLAFMYSKGIAWASTWWSLLLAIVIQLIGGAVIGIILGCLAGMFPDRRSLGAPYCRILFIGTGTAALVMGFHSLGMSGVGVLSSSTMVVIASNIWEELGWHQTSNPVLYFYSILYFFAQPIGVSLVGFTMKFDKMPYADVGISIATVIVGTAARELLCLAVIQNPALKIKKKEKIFITLSWLPKGIAEALLAAVLGNFVRENFVYINNNNYTLDELLGFAKKILRSTILGVLLTAPFSALLTTMLTPLLSNKV